MEATLRSVRSVRLFSGLLVAVGLLLVLSSGALAAKLTFHDHFTETFPDAICGVTGTSTVKVNQVGTDTGTSFKVFGQVTQVFTADDGRSATLHNAGKVTGSRVENGDGTVTFTTAFKGLPEQIRGAKGGVTTRDAGIITIITTVDLATGDVISEKIVSRGPHPEADSGFAIFCDAFLAALG